MKILVEGNELKNGNKPEAGDIIICENGYAYLLDDANVVTKFKDGTSQEIEHLNNYEIAGKVASIIVKQKGDE